MTTTALPARQLGSLRVSAIGYGAMVLSPGMYGDIDDSRALKALQHAIDAGATLIDTSDFYGGDGHNETLVGRAIADRRNDVVVATKFGLNIPAGAERHRFPVGFDFGELSVNNDPRFVRRYAEASLRRLGIEWIDLYYPHFPDPVIPIEETVGAVAELVRDGLVAHLGLSNVPADQVRRAAAVHDVAAVQVEWSMWKPIDTELLEAVDAVGAGIVAWSPLGAGFLTGTVEVIGTGDFRRDAPRFQGDNLTRNNDRYAPLRRIAGKLGIMPSQLALAWLLHQHPTVVPIPGSRTPAHIEENLHAADVKLDADTLQEVDHLLRTTTPLGRSFL